MAERSGRSGLRARLWRVAGPVVGAANAAGRWRRRQGLLLQVSDGEGIRAVGEASPLPAYSPDGLDAALRALRAWVSDAHRLDPPIDVRGVGAAVEAIPAQAPSARFAAETALLDLLGQRLGMPVHHLLAPPATGAGPRIPSPLPLAALETGLDPGRAVAAFASRWRSGWRTLKVKVGRPGDARAELRLLEALRRAYGGGLALRLDANGAWTPEQAARHLQRLAALEPELLEEPVATADWVRLEPSPGVPLALDESLAVPGFYEELAPRFGALGVRAVVLKPLILGGVLPALGLARRARAAELQTVVSHAFEGPVALQAACHLAVALAAETSGAPVPAQGLARHAGLRAWSGVFGGHSQLASGDRGLEVPQAPGSGLDAPRLGPLHSAGVEPGFEVEEVEVR
ncbi:MAG: o-succinylbenzoate synthase [Holophagales bacterium]|nr:o-succinylbenzoate synthase [Holophagales bacterium]